jgi:hypothetical protein
MKSALTIFGLAFLGFAVTTANAQNAGKTADNPGGCKVVRLKPGQHAPSGTLSSTVTAGGGKVSGTTTGSSNSVTVHSGSGNSSSVVTSGSSGNGASTTVTSANGDCTIYVNPGRK